MPSPAPLRRHPQQERSRRMVERILEAAHEVLLAEGHDAASTNRIARRAGISPGSLYQYFDGKEAIVDAVVARYSDDLAARVAAAFTTSLGAHGEAVAHDSVAALLAALEADAEMLRVVTEQLPSAHHRERLVALRDQVTQLVSTYLAAQRPTRAVDPETAAWLLVRTVEQLTVRYVLDAPSIAREVFVSELTHLVLAHLEPRRT